MGKPCKCRCTAVVPPTPPRPDFDGNFFVLHFQDEADSKIDGYAPGPGLAGDTAELAAEKLARWESDLSDLFIKETLTGKINIAFIQPRHTIFTGSSGDFNNRWLLPSSKIGSYSGAGGLPPQFIYANTCSRYCWRQEETPTNDSNFRNVKFSSTQDDRDMMKHITENIIRGKFSCIAVFIDNSGSTRREDILHILDEWYWNISTSETSKTVFPPARDMFATNKSIDYVRYIVDENGDPNPLENCELIENVRGPNDRIIGQKDADDCSLGQVFPKCVVNENNNGSERYLPHISDAIEAIANSEDCGALDAVPSKVSISVVALDNSAQEEEAANNQTASFRIILSKPYTEDIYVNFSISGTATIDTDYSIAPDPRDQFDHFVAVIPAGEQEYILTVTAIDDAIVDSPETVILELFNFSPDKPEDIVVNQTQKKATITITDSDIGSDPGPPDSDPATACHGDLTGCLVNSTGRIGTGWDALCRAFHDPAHSKVVNFTYSYMQDNATGNEGHTSGEHVHIRNIEGISEADFKAQITLAFSIWKDFIEWMCPQVTVNFTDLGDENLSVPIGTEYNFASLPAGSNVGDFRIGADDPMSNPSTIAHAHYPTRGEPGVLGGIWGDLHFNVDKLFRKDLDTAGTAYSVLYIALHELGHALGLNHIEYYLPGIDSKPDGSDWNEHRTEGDTRIYWPTKRHDVAWGCWWPSIMAANVSKYNSVHTFPGFFYNSTTEKYSLKSDIRVIDVFRAVYNLNFPIPNVQSYYYPEPTYSRTYTGRYYSSATSISTITNKVINPGIGPNSCWNCFTQGTTTWDNSTECDRLTDT